LDPSTSGALPLLEMEAIGHDGSSESGRHMSDPQHDDLRPGKVRATAAQQTVAVAVFLGILLLLGLVNWYAKFGQHG
jgi:hypothetical protein